MKKIAKQLINDISAPLLNKIHRFKDIHKGESCYLFGDGISIKWFDLGNFADKTAIPVTYIPFHKDSHKLDIRYLLLTEPWYFFPYFKTTVPPYSWWRNRIQLAYREVIRNNPDKQFFINLSNLPVMRGNNITYLFRNLQDKRLPDNFFTYRTEPFNGSVRGSISLAAYLGFSHIYLVGFDYTHYPSRSLHWYEKGEGVIVDQGEYNKDFFQMASEFVDITTITLDGGSKVLNSVTYKEFTGKDPVYKENTELMDMEHLKLLNTWPDYKIF